LNACNIFSQEVKAYATIDTSKIRIGEQTKIDLYIVYKSTCKNCNIQWPRISDTLRKEIDVVNVSKIDTTIPDKNKPDEIQQHQTITITSIDSGYWAISPFAFIVNNDTAKPIETQPFLLEVFTVPVDTAEASIRDIKAPLDEPFDWHEYLPYIYWSVAALLVIIIIIFLIVKFAKKKPDTIVPPRPKEPPHITALQNLENVRNRKLWQEGKYKEYHTLISDTLRMYIEGRYGVAAMELTSDEIFKVMKSQVIDPVSMEKLRQVLILADYVKFAKVVPIDVENELSLNSAIDFVNGTKREETDSNEQLPGDSKQ
ncbi:MAG TPA: hypothetical protein VNY73_10075, partial [Bacteroidia bacterium]|nr:hypothetical protein [Bacteroidia bacterium]